VPAAGQQNCTAWSHRTNLYVSFSANSLSPTSNVGNIDREGMKRGSATNLAEPQVISRPAPATQVGILTYHLIP
jgi:hypothetical protein